mgnify:CR=1 FL=1
MTLNEMKHKFYERNDIRVLYILLGEQVPLNGICRKLDPDKESNHLEDTRKPDRPEGIRKLDQHKVPD